MIELNKKYKTRSGNEVKILSIDKNDLTSFSAIKWEIIVKVDCSWSLYGNYCSDFIESPNDLIKENND
jgi:hypothetical protein